ncbi:XRE family transcriptional regulator [Streptomyces armeniacus]|uniref:XRE family transcriptional regulator n=1 Tax=Streptomyces armeniacus TaxID=83291 RepID=A0A345XMR0_9ACTN|nr:XRE family transcriptional regulator [Streptomyces armeniacus]AXK32926.1 XRE family transcriptional regulator [Streptomyces armeniacus]
MPRWKALPDGLDPQISEFTSQLRRLVDRSGMSLATIADRTEYSKSSWERYLNGRLLPPRGAVQALADVTGTEVRHLATMWELAERAWSRSEMRHDMTMEAIQVAQARAALSPTGETPAKGWKWGIGGKNAKNPAPAGPPPGAVGTPAPPPAAGAGAADSARDAGAAGPVGAAGAAASAASSAPATPAASPAPPADDQTAVMRPRTPRTPRPDAAVDRGTTRLNRPSLPDSSASAPAPAPAPKPVAAPGPVGNIDPQSWGTRRTPEVAEAPPAHASAAPPGTPPAPPSAAPHPAAGVPGGHGDTTAQREPGGDGGGRGRQLLMLAAGVVAALIVVAGAVFAFDLTGGDDSAAPDPTPTAENPDLPAGVKCSGADCNGKDPETMGCGGQYAKTAGSRKVGPRTVEVRYSKVCGAAWARVTGGANGDLLRISGGKRTQTEDVDSPDAYTPMVPVKNVQQARACVKPAAGARGCARGTATAPAP